MYHKAFAASARFILALGEPPKLISGVSLGRLYLSEKRVAKTISKI